MDGCTFIYTLGYNSVLLSPLSTVEGVNFCFRQTAMVEQVLMQAGAEMIRGWASLLVKAGLFLVHH